MMVKKFQMKLRTHPDSHHYRHNDTRACTHMGITIELGVLRRAITKTCDSGVAAFFRRPCRAGRRNDNVEEEKLEYIGQILEIVELITDAIAQLFWYVIG